MIQIDGIKGLGTHWWFELFDCTKERRDEVKIKLQKIITQFDDDYSRFKSTSYVGRLNDGEAIIQPPTELVTLLTIGLDLYQETSGVFNIMTGSQQEANGYDTSYSFTASKGKTNIADPTKALAVSPEKITLAEGVVDIGGFGKGFLIDKLARVLLEECACEQFLINGGGDMYATHHNNGPVEVLLEHPTKAKQYVARVPLQNSALGASSTYKRTWATENTKEIRSHLVHPTAVDQPVRMASFVVAKNALAADMAATMLCIAPEQAVVAGEYFIIKNETSIQHSPGFAAFILTTGQ